MYTSRGLEELAVLKDQYNSKNRQAQLFFNRKPAPTKANLEALNRNYADLSAAFQTVQGTLNLNPMIEIFSLAMLLDPIMKRSL